MHRRPTRAARGKGTAPEVPLGVSGYRVDVRCGGAARRADRRSERAIIVLIDGANDDIEDVLKTRRKLPSLGLPAPRLKARAMASTR